MADNVAITAGTGTTIHADEYTHSTLGSGKTQLVKLVDGTLDSSTPIASGSGTATSALRVELPTNGTGVIATVGAVTAITNALPSGSNAIGKLAANSGVDIGDVDVTSCALPTGAATSAKQDTGNSSLSSIDGKITACNTGAVVLAAGSAAIGKLAANSGVDIGDVDVASCALPTGASTAANQSTIIGHVDGIETLLGTIDADTSTLSGAVSGTEMQVDVVASLPAGTNAIGKLAANSGVDIGDVDILSIAAGDNNIGNVDIASITNGSINGPASPTVDSYTTASINLAAGANQVLASSSANHQIWVYGLGFTVNAAGTVSFQDEDDTAITGVMPFAANSGMAVPPSGNFAMPLWKLATDKDLEVDIVTSEVDGWISYAIVNA